MSCKEFCPRYVCKAQWQKIEKSKSKSDLLVYIRKNEYTFWAYNCKEITSTISKA